jgi:hypothetical protein
VKVLPIIPTEFTLLGEENQQRHEYLYWEFGAKGGQLAVRMGNLKGVKQKVINNPEVQWEIYDLAQDRSETTNIAVQHPEMPAKFDAIVAKRRPAHIKEWNFMDYDAQ